MANMTDVFREVRLIQSICSFSISTLGMLCNGFAIYQIVSRKLYRQNCNIYILNLCINNLVTCLFILPIFGVNSFFETWSMGSNFCRVFPYLMHTIACTETSSLVLITINRYTLVVHPARYKIYFSKKYFNIVLLTTPVVFFLLLQALPLAGIWGHFEYHPIKLYCTYSSDAQTRKYVVFLCSFLLMTDIPILIYCYSRILAVYLASKRRLASTEVAKEQQQSCLWLPSKQDAQLIRIIVIIIVCYSVTHVPFLFVNVIDTNFKQLGIVGYTLLAYLALSHTTINPVVYVLLNTQINGNIRCWWKRIMPAPKTKVTTASS